MLFGVSRLTGLAADNLADKLNTLTLVRFRLAERTNLCAYLAEKLLVGALENDKRILVTFCLGFYLDFLRKLWYPRKIEEIRSKPASAVKYPAPLSVRA